MRWQSIVLILYLFPGALTCRFDAAAAGPPEASRYPVGGREREGAQGPAVEYYQALHWLKEYAERLEKSLGDRLPEARGSLRQIQDDATFLQLKWLEWARRNPNKSPYSGNLKLDPYFRAVQGAQRQLKDLKKRGDTELSRVVEAVAADIHAKAENCRHSADGLGKEIKVMVRTKKGTEEIGGYQIWCAPMALVGFKDEHIRFPKISSPSVMKNLPPGYYVMWLEKDRQKTEPVPQTIGGKGELDVEVDLVVE